MHLPGKPQGKPGEIHKAASAWRDIARVMGSNQATVIRAVHGLSDWRGPSRDSFDRIWMQFSRDIDRATRQATDTARELDTYADKLLSAQHKYDAAAVSAGLLVTGGAVLTFVSFGISDVVMDSAAVAALSAAIAVAEEAVASFVASLVVFVTEFPQIAVAVAAGTSVAAIDLASGVPIDKSLQDGEIVFMMEGLTSGGSGGDPSSEESAADEVIAEEGAGSTGGGASRSGGGSPGFGNLHPAADDPSLAEGWHSATFGSPSESFDYHYGRHATELGYDVTPQQYAADARAFAANPTEGSRVLTKTTISRDGVTEIYRYTTPGGGPGGYLDSNGNIITFWYNSK